MISEINLFPHTDFRVLSFNWILGKVHWLLFFTLLILSNWGCQRVSENYRQNNAEVSTSDLIKDSLAITYAKGFQIEYGEGFKVLHILTPFQDTRDSLSYLLVEDGVPVPDSFQDLPRIAVPIKNLIALSTTHIGLLEALNSLDVLKGVANAKFLCDTLLREKAKNGNLISVGEDHALNTEKVLSANPDLLMVSAMQSENFGRFKILQQAEIPVLVNAEWLENTLLGRAEWIKVMGALLNEEKKALSYFDDVVSEYNELKAIAATIAKNKRVTVITSMPYKGIWYVPGGDSYLSHLLQDAGAIYPWAGTPETGSLSFDFEKVFPVAVKAEYWFPGDLIQTKSDILERDKRFSEFKSFATSEIYINNKRTCEGGGNAYWTTGVVNPHLILADYIKALYPQLLPDYQLFYHKRIESDEN